MADASLSDASLSLVALTPCAGVLPVTTGALTLSEADPGHLTVIAPLRGKAAALAAALKAAHGLDWPAPNRTTGGDGARLIWFGHAHVLLMGPAPDPALSDHASLTDVSDGWASVRLQGAGAADVLARLSPIDLRAGVFQAGHTARTELMHMQASITRLSDDGFLIMGFRSMAATLVHDLTIAMAGVEARRAD